MSHVRQVMKSMTKISHETNNLKEKSALDVCLKLLDLSMHRLRSFMVALKNQDNHDDVHTWLSSVLSNHVTCLDILEVGLSHTAMEPELHDLVERSRASLDIFIYLPVPLIKKTTVKDKYFPSWIKNEDKKLLAPEAKVPMKANVNVVVAKDGSGKYKTVVEAVAAAPDNNAARYVIYMKAVVYGENVEICQNKINLMIVGDGMDATVITGSLNHVDGSQTINTTTVAAFGNGFIGKDLWFQNSVGP